MCKQSYSGPNCATSDLIIYNDESECTYPSLFPTSSFRPFVVSLALLAPPIITTSSLITSHPFFLILVMQLLLYTHNHRRGHWVAVLVTAEKLALSLGQRPIALVYLSLLIPISLNSSLHTYPFFHSQTHRMSIKSFGQQNLYRMDKPSLLLALWKTGWTHSLLYVTTASLFVCPLLY